MIIDLNGSPSEVADDLTVIEFVETLAGTARGSAVVVDGEVVPRSTWPTLALRAGQAVELVTAVQGG